MANHDYARVGNVWTSLSNLTAGEMQLIDFNAADAISGLGGTYALDEDMVIGGDPGVEWSFDLPVSFAETATFDIAVFDSFTQFNALATFSAGASFGDETFFDDTATFNIAVFDSFTQFNALATFSAGASFGDEAFFNDDATFNADGIFEGDVYFNGTAFLCQSQSVFFDTVTLRDVVSFTSAGKLAYRSVTNATNADHTVLGAQVDSYYNPNGVLSGATNVTIDDTGATDGMRIKFWNNDNTHNLTVRGPGATVLEVMGANTGCEAERIGGVWRKNGD